MRPYLDADTRKCVPILWQAFGIDSAEEELAKAGRKAIRPIDSSKQGLLEVQPEGRA